MDAPAPTVLSVSDVDPEVTEPAAPSTSLVTKPQEDSCVLKLKGLPYTTSEEQIRKFFEGFAVKTVAFVYEPDGRPSGLVSHALIYIALPPSARPNVDLALRRLPCVLAIVHRLQHAPTASLV